MSCEVCRSCSLRGRTLFKEAMKALLRAHSATTYGFRSIHLHPEIASTCANFSGLSLALSEDRINHRKKETKRKKTQDEDDDDYKLRELRQ